MTAQLNSPITPPSVTMINHTVEGEAPIARSTPISRRRSRTLRLIVVISPNPPTPASTIVQVGEVAGRDRIVDGR